MTEGKSNLPVPADEKPVAARRRFSLGFPQRREKVIRRGIIATAIAPLAGAIGLVILLAAIASIGTNWWTGYSRDELFTRAVQPDASVASVRTGEPLNEEVTLLVRDADGSVRRLVAERDAADRFVNDTLRRLDVERERIAAASSDELASVFAFAFADREDAVERYADWFFAWKRSYVVLKEAVVSTATRLARIGEYEGLSVAVERDLKEYFLRHYSEQVLRPEHRDPMIAAGFEQTARRAHERWQRVVAEQDLRLQLFLVQHTRHLEGGTGAAPLTEVSLDWDAQRFKAPIYLMEDKAFDGIVSLATVGAGGTLGALALRPAIERASSRIFAGLGRRYAAALAGRVAFAEAGAVAGTAVQPVSGTVIGAMAGGLVGLAADYALNEASAAMNREGFVTANLEAVDATVDVWQSKLETNLHAAVDRWFADTRAGVVSVR